MFENAKLKVSLTAEMVTDGHPDKFCDQVADAILDTCLREDPNSRVAVECLAKDNLLIISGEMSTKAKLNIEQIARMIWQEIGYGDPAELVVINHIKEQSTDIARGHKSFGVDFGGAGAKAETSSLPAANGPQDLAFL